MLYGALGSGARDGRDDGNVATAVLFDVCVLLHALCCCIATRDKSKLDFGDLTMGASPSPIQIKCLL